MTASYKAAAQLVSEDRLRARGLQLHASAAAAPAGGDRCRPRREAGGAAPLLVQRELRQVHEEFGIVTEAWSPIGGITRYYLPDTPNHGRNALEESDVTELAAKYGKTPAQVVLRWHIEQGVCAIPSVTPHRIAENLSGFDFSLTPAEVAAIDTLDTGLRSGARARRWTASPDTSAADRPGREGPPGGTRPFDRHQLKATVRP
ncbi:aldo/keto reductase [Streptomyces sp. NPDC057199]|uniref:aldo/keto reductase n=1 Tax=Streptomyces sp. NPDC057199 TaxID=3346047 RepID=UPI003625155B